MSISRAALFSAISLTVALGLSSAANAAESQASSMAGGMNESGATVNSSSMASENGTNQSSGMSSSQYSTSRTSQSHNYDSSLTGGGTSVAVKNVAGTGATLQNFTEPAKGLPLGSGALPVQKPSPNAMGNVGGLIENNVHQSEALLKESNKMQGSSERGSAVSTSTTINAAPAAASKAKVQYWNRTTRRTR